MLSITVTVKYFLSLFDYIRWLGYVQKRADTDSWHREIDEQGIQRRVEHISMKSLCLTAIGWNKIN